MTAITTIIRTPNGGYAIYNAVNELIATARQTVSKNGKYLIKMVGGIAHGKIAYAADFQDLNDKSVEIANLR